MNSAVCSRVATRSVAAVRPVALAAPRPSLRWVLGVGGSQCARRAIGEPGPRASPSRLLCCQPPDAWSAANEPTPAACAPPDCRAERKAAPSTRSSTVARVAPVEIAQVASEWGMISGVAGTMWAITLLVSGSGARPACRARRIDPPPRAWVRTDRTRLQPAPARTLQPHPAPAHPARACPPACCRACPWASCCCAWSPWWRRASSKQSPPPPPTRAQPLA